MDSYSYIAIVTELYLDIAMPYDRLPYVYNQSFVLDN